MGGGGDGGEGDGGVGVGVGWGWGGGVGGWWVVVVGAWERNRYSGIPSCAHAE